MKISLSLLVLCAGCLQPDVVVGGCTPREMASACGDELVFETSWSQEQTPLSYFAREGEICDNGPSWCPCGDDKLNGGLVDWLSCICAWLDERGFVDFDGGPAMKRIKSAGCADEYQCHDQVCGNGAKEGTELCDGEDFGGDTCQDHGCSGGELSELFQLRTNYNPWMHWL
jgi:hypothetical protein